MTRLLFLLSPALFGGLCLLLGETIHLAKKRRHLRGLEKTVVVMNTGRK